jgi:RNA polymerase sigma-70 factor, ECF subfamily
MSNLMPPKSSPLSQKSEAPVGFTGTPGAMWSPAGSNIISIDARMRRRKAEHPIAADVPDEVLISATARGDRGAMSLLYGRHQVRVYRFALRITRDATLAEDVVSEVFLDVWRRADGFKMKSRVSTWLLAITRHKSLTAVSRRFEDQLDERPIEMVDPADGPEMLFQKKDRGEIVRRCLWQLSAVQREVIDLVYYHGKTIAEVAEIVGAPVGTIKTRMFLARRKLGAFLKAEHVIF